MEQLKSLLNLDENATASLGEKRAQKKVITKGQLAQLKRLKSKQRMNQVRLEHKPTREENPVQFSEKLVKSAQETIFGDRNVLSRGQRKRLQKKEKFINVKILEEKAKLDFKDKHEKKKVPKKITKVIKKASTDLDMLAKSLVSIEKQSKHKQRVKDNQIQKQQDEKERLNQIAQLSAFQENPLDALFAHVSNTIQQKN